MGIFNNTTKVFRNDLEKIIPLGNKISIAAVWVSIYASHELNTVTIR